MFETRRRRVPVYLNIREGCIIKKDIEEGTVESYDAFTGVFWRIEKRRRVTDDSKRMAFIEELVGKVNAEVPEL